ncbi:hypothetical protein CVT24_012304 [Panaeolus cyanescens]|uniref:Uncharacterized protein n=1 Tax=Panaeolus cyanescens TaxID=181874 RepID=A0A409W482_9AGAR|nr:hypothetical protein CVT24_012304 [Panaeolus cyanescens]
MAPSSASSISTPTSSGAITPYAKKDDKGFFMKTLESMALSAEMAQMALDPEWREKNQGKLPGMPGQFGSKR